MSQATDQNDDGMRESFRQAANEKIGECGWMVTNMFHIDQQRRTHSVVYTIGLHVAGLPELVIVGLDLSVAQKIINHAARRSLSQEPAVGERWILENFNSDLTFTFAPVAPSWAATHMRRIRHTHPQWAPGDDGVLQVLWPDINGNFPGNAFYVVEPHAQPLLCDSDEHFRIPPRSRAGLWTSGHTQDTDTGGRDTAHADMETPPQ